MFQVKPSYLLRLKIHRPSSCFCPFFHSHQKDDQDHLKSNGKFSVKENSGKHGDNEIQQTEQKHQRSEELEHQKNFTSNLRRKSFSPGKRLAALLPDNFETTIDNGSVNEYKNFENKDKEHTESNENQFANKEIRQGRDFMKERFKARTKIQPSKRIASMLPPEYWKSLEDSETKQIVEDLGENVDADSKKSSE